AVAQVDSGNAIPDCEAFYTLMTSKTTDIPTNPACSFDSGSISYQYKQTPNTTNPTGYCITSTNGNVSYKIDSTASSNPASGACSGHGVGGVGAITNMVMNPRGTSYL